ncbi:MAG: hypothetical protein AAGU05_15910, partial [Anaerolineaceae bacterium]
MPETQNATPQPARRRKRRHGFYSRAWQLAGASGLEPLNPRSLEEEVALLRLYMRRLVEADQAETDLKTMQELIRTLSVACQTIVRLVKAQSGLHRDEDGELQQALDQAIREVTREFGLDR